MFNRLHQQEAGLHLKSARQLLRTIAFTAAAHPNVAD